MKTYLRYGCVSTLDALCGRQNEISLTQLLIHDEIFKTILTIIWWYTWLKFQLGCISQAIYHWYGSFNLSKILAPWSLLWEERGRPIIIMGEVRHSNLREIDCLAIQKAHYQIQRQFSPCFTTLFLTFCSSPKWLKRYRDLRRAVRSKGRDKDYHE